MRGRALLSALLCGCSFADRSVFLSGGALEDAGDEPIIDVFSPPDAVVPVDSAIRDVRPTDSPVATDRVDAGTVDASTSRAGAPCTMPDPMGGADPACGDGGLLCVPTWSLPMCTNFCTNNASQADERSQCGGAGSTCLTSGDGTNARSNCAASCRPSGSTTATGACRAGFICTGWWFTHAAGAPDSTGCYGFCNTDSHCGTGMHCNTHTGECSATGTDMSRLPDGSPCDPNFRVMVPGSDTPQNIQCRGICFRIGTSTTQGICGSMINTRASTMCPDDPDNVIARAPSGGTDNLAVCLWRNCTANANCRAPLICRYPEDASGTPVTDADPVCDYPTTVQRVGIVGDAGTPTDR